MDYGAHAPYILAAYAVSIIAIGVLIAFRIRRYRAAKHAEREAPAREN